MPRPVEMQVGLHPGALAPPDGLDGPEEGAGVPLNAFTGYQVNPARLNGEDINPNTLQTQRVAYWDGVQLRNGVDGTTTLRFGPSQFYVLSDSYPGQANTVPGGKAPGQVLTPSDIAAGPAYHAAGSPQVIPTAGVYGGGPIYNPGGC